MENSDTPKPAPIIDWVGAAWTGAGSVVPVSDAAAAVPSEADFTLVPQRLMHSGSLWLLEILRAASFVVTA